MRICVSYIPIYLKKRSYSRKMHIMITSGPLSLISGKEIDKK